MAKKHKAKEVGNIGNYYGGIWITKYDGCYWWTIENYDFNPDASPFDRERWEEITPALYRHLKNHVSLIDN